MSRKILSIVLWKELGAPVKPNSMHLNWKSPDPESGQKTVLCWSLSWTGNCQYPLWRSSVEKIVDLPNDIEPHLQVEVYKHLWTVGLFVQLTIVCTFSTRQTFSVQTLLAPSKDYCFLQWCLLPTFSRSSSAPVHGSGLEYYVVVPIPEIPLWECSDTPWKCLNFLMVAASLGLGHCGSSKRTAFPKLLTAKSSIILAAWLLLAVMVDTWAAGW